MASGVTTILQSVTRNAVNVTVTSVTAIARARGGFAYCHGVTRDVTQRNCDKYRDSHGCLRRDRSATRQGRAWA